VAHAIALVDGALALVVALVGQRGDDLHHQVGHPVVLAVAEGVGVVAGDDQHVGVDLHALAPLGVDLGQVGDQVEVGLEPAPLQLGRDEEDVVVV
jgi:hypothetical protein